MNSAKSANLLMTAHKYISHSKKVFLVKPSTDKRPNIHTINSCVVPKAAVDMIIGPRTADMELLVPRTTSCVLVDDAQFLTYANVNALRTLTSRTPVVCYGLRTDYRSQLFEGSRRLMEVADSIEEIHNVCATCTKKAILNSKYYSSYRALCWECWNEDTKKRTPTASPSVS